MMGNKCGDGSKATSRGESWRHYICKCITHKIIMDKGNKSLMEWNCGTRVIDVAQKLESGKWIGYEIQSGRARDKKNEMIDFLSRNPQFEDIIVIDLGKMVMGNKAIIFMNGLRKELEGWVV
jgi:hypothetical protein